MPKWCSPLVLLICFQSISGYDYDYDVFTGSCSDIDTLIFDFGSSVHPCCSANIFNKPQYCFYMREEVQNVAPRCSCHVQNSNRVIPCRWGDSDLGDPECELITKKCEGRSSSVITQLMNVNYDKKKENNLPPISCIPTSDRYSIGYPPRAELLGHIPLMYCDDKYTDVYNGPFKCWLHDCENRLKIPKETFETLEDLETMNIRGSRLCYPPILVDWSRSDIPSAKLKMKSDGLTYCELYTARTDVYYVEDERDAKGCVLPPICSDEEGKENKVDINVFMPVVKDKNTDVGYCERVCHETKNDGKTFDGKPCRFRPSCYRKNENVRNMDEERQYNPYQIPYEYCIPWCDDITSLLRNSTKHLREGKHCNAVPLCRDSKGNMPNFTSNPFHSSRCLTTTCNEELVPTRTHHCFPPNGQDGEEEGLGLTLIVIIIVAGVIVGLCILGGVILCIYKMKTTAQKTALETLSKEALEVRIQNAARNERKDGQLGTPKEQVIRTTPVETPHSPVLSNRQSKKRKGKVQKVNESGESETHKKKSKKSKKIAKVQNSHSDEEEKVEESKKRMKKEEGSKKKTKKDEEGRDDVGTPTVQVENENEVGEDKKKKQDVKKSKKSGKALKIKTETEDENGDESKKNQKKKTKGSGSGKGTAKSKQMKAESPMGDGKQDDSAKKSSIKGVKSKLENLETEENADGSVKQKKTAKK